MIWNFRLVGVVFALRTEARLELEVCVLLRDCAGVNSLSLSFPM
jgi:hypothetical protein